MTNLDLPRRYTTRIGSFQAGSQDHIRCLGITQRSIYVPIHIARPLNNKCHVPSTLLRSRRDGVATSSGAQ